MLEQLKKDAEKEFKEKILLRTGEIKIIWGEEISEFNYRDAVIQFINSQIEKSHFAGKKEAIEEIKKEFGRYELTNVVEILDYLNKL